MRPPQRAAAIRSTSCANDRRHAQPGRRATLSLAATLTRRNPDPRPVALALFLASGYKTHPHAHERAAPGRTTQIAP
eukprot:1796205-Prymnesium_polylepis.1